MTKPAPKMPANLSPLTMGRNGKPLVYLGNGGTFRIVAGLIRDRFYIHREKGWSLENINGKSPDSHYAAESNSEVCKLNGWGDFAPVELKPVEKKTALQIYIEAAKQASEEAERNYAAAKESADAWFKHLKECNVVLAQLVKGDVIPPIERKVWYDAGRKDERAHAKVQTVFPSHP